MNTLLLLILSLVWGFDWYVFLYKPASTSKSITETKDIKECPRIMVLDLVIIGCLKVIHYAVISMQTIPLDSDINLLYHICACIFPSQISSVLTKSPEFKLLLKHKFSEPSAPSCELPTLTSLKNDPSEELGGNRINVSEAYETENTIEKVKSLSFIFLNY